MPPDGRSRSSSRPAPSADRRTAGPSDRRSAAPSDGSNAGPSDRTTDTRFDRSTVARFDRLPGPLSDPRTRVFVAVTAIAVLALAIRLWALGWRIAHQDEARVAYWAYRYMETGVYWYRPIVHGPFLTIVDSHVFALFGASDFTMRFVVALVGGLLPLSALLFRTRLDDAETVALAVLLAANPLVLYYSRFYRNDLLLAGFMLAAVGCYVRTIDERRPAWLYAGTALFALAFTTKENALLYPVTWAGAAVLLADRRVLVSRATDHSIDAFLDRASVAVRDARRTARSWLPHAIGAPLLFFAIFVFFYAPRGAAAGASPTLGATVADPTLLPALVDEAIFGSWDAFVGQWGSGNDSSYLDAVEAFVPVLGTGAIALLLLAVIGFVVDRYTGSRPRDLVAFTSFWGLASAIGYPIAVDNPFPWEMLHVVVPLAVPAAVGLALVARIGIESYDADDTVGAAIAAVIVLVVAAQMGFTGYTTSYAEPQSDDNPLVQYAQSSSEMKPLLHEMQRIARENEGTDVLFYGDDPGFDGDELYAPNESSHDTPTAGAGWFERLPLIWYLEAAGATTDSTRDPGAVGDRVDGDDRPPIVIAFGDVQTCSEEYHSADDIEEHMSGYERHEVDRFLHDSGCILSSVVVYVDQDQASNAVVDPGTDAVAGPGTGAVADTGTGAAASPGTGAVADPETNVHAHGTGGTVVPHIAPGLRPNAPRMW